MRNKRKRRPALFGKTKTEQKKLLLTALAEKEADSITKGKITRVDAGEIRENVYDRGQLIRKMHRVS